MIVNQGNWCQATVPTGTVGIRTVSAILKREGYRVSVSSIGQQITSLGALKMTLIDIRPGKHLDTFNAENILRSHIAELRIQQEEIMTTNHKPATALPPTARLKQIGYMLDHPGSFGEVSAYLAQLEHKNQRLVAFLGGIDAVDHNLYTRAQTILRELGEL